MDLPANCTKYYKIFENVQKIIDLPRNCTKYHKIFENVPKIVDFPRNCTKYYNILENFQKQSGEQNKISYIVIDEWVGQWIALSFLPVNLSFALLGFILFRFFDISKIGPVKYFEKLPGAVGVMADDVAAGFLSMLTIYLLRVTVI